MKKIIICLLFSLLISHSLFAKTLRFAAEATYPPFEYVDATGKMIGFDIDIAKAICAKINAQCEFSSQAFNSLIPSIKMGKFDAVISAVGITPLREKQVAFSDTYYEPTASFVAAKQRAFSLNTISGHMIGVQEGTTFQQYLDSKYGNKIEIKSYLSIQDAFLDLIAHRIDIVLADTPIALEWLHLADHQKTFSIIENPIVDKDFFGAGYGIAVKKNNQELLTQLNQGLAAIKTDGTYAKIFAKYFNHTQP